MSDLPTPRELLIAWHASQAERRRRPPPEPPGGPMPAADATTASTASTAAAVIAAAAALGARVITLLDPDYPRELAAIAVPPPVLFVRGCLPAAPAVAIVGSRLADAYGLEVAARFARHLAAAGVVVVSGIAHGIDAAAHEGALAVPRGRTVAVLGCGLGIDYPGGHARLAAAIAARGALVSEFPCGTLPRPWCFTVRNRTIAALAAVTLVVQATPRSGSLNTARHARNLGRPVFAVPGPVCSPLSWGPHDLLRRGARLAGHPEDVLDALPATAEIPPEAMPAEDRVSAQDAASSAPAVAAVLAALRPRAARGVRPRRSADQVAALAGLEPDTVLRILLELEVAGRVERLHGLAYRLAKRTARGRRPAGAS